MDLKDFQDVGDDAKDISKDVAKGAGKKAKRVLVDENFHDESDKVIKDLEARIAALHNEDKKKVDEVKKQENHEGENVSEVQENSDEVQNSNNLNENNLEEDVEKVYVEEGGGTFLDKIGPFILPICLTLFALIFAAIFMYFFSKSRVEKTAQAIQNVQTQPEVIIIKETKPEVKEVVVIEEKVVPECDLETQVLNEELNECEDLPPPPKPVFYNGTTTIVNVRFAYDRLNYDTFPMGIYLLENQNFEGEYEGFKLLATNRAYANDFFFGVDRYMVSLLGACKFVIDDAEILVENMYDSEGGAEQKNIGKNYFTGKVAKILNASKPHIVCGAMPKAVTAGQIQKDEYKDNTAGNRVTSPRGEVKVTEEAPEEEVVEE